MPCNSETVSRVLKAGLSIHHAPPPAGLLRSLMLLKGCGVVIHLCKRVGRVLSFLCIQEFTDDLRNRLWTVWRDDKGLNTQDINSMSC